MVKVIYSQNFKREEKMRMNIKTISSILAAVGVFMVALLIIQINEKPYKTSPSYTTVYYHIQTGE